MGNEWLEDVLNYNNDIEPYPFVGIYAGVGSGKTSYVIKLAKGEIAEVPAKKILLITSRRSKVNETRADKSLPQDTAIGQHDGHFPYCETMEELDSILNSEQTIIDPGWGEQTIYQRFVTCTNAAIEIYFAQRYCEQHLTTHLWNRFDLIVLDEAHAVRADASYQSAPYYVQRLMNVIRRKNIAGETTCKAIVMTGTPEIISNYGFPQSGNELDLRERCVNVAPKKVKFINRKQAKSKMRAMLQRGERGIYFYNHVDELLKDYKKIREENPECASRIGISFTKKKCLDSIRKDDMPLFQKIEDIRIAIETTSKIPGDISFLFSSERNKEGINIEDTDIKTMFVESHAEATIIQMAGRVRNGLDTLYVITDSVPHNNRESVYEWSLTQYQGISETVNDKLNEVFRYENYDPHTAYKAVCEYSKVWSYIQFIHSKYPYLRYDYIDHKFVLYGQRRGSIVYYKTQEELFQESVVDSVTLCQLGEKWFPNAIVTDELPASEKVSAYIEEHGLLEVKISQAEQCKLKNFILDLIGEPEKTTAKLGTLLKQFGYGLKLEHRSKPKGVIFKLDE